MSIKHITHIPPSTHSRSRTSPNHKKKTHGGRGRRGEVAQSIRHPRPLKPVIASEGTRTTGPGRPPLFITFPAGIGTQPLGNGALIWVLHFQLGVCSYHLAMSANIGSDS